MLRVRPVANADATILSIGVPAGRVGPSGTASARLVGICAIASSPFVIVDALPREIPRADRQAIVRLDDDAEVRADVRAAAGEIDVREVGALAARRCSRTSARRRP